METQCEAVKSELAGKTKERENLLAQISKDNDILTAKRQLAFEKSAEAANVSGVTLLKIKLDKNNQMLAEALEFYNTINEFLGQIIDNELNMNAIIEGGITEQAIKKVVN